MLRLGDKEATVFFTLMDFINNTFKKWKLFSPGEKYLVTQQTCIWQE